MGRFSLAASQSCHWEETVLLLIWIVEGLVAGKSVGVCEQLDWEGWFVSLEPRSGSMSIPTQSNRKGNVRISR